ncbi:hypothetical protein M1555_02530 [Patescibacteria group bacterium]|nr:hypothetical protein [Patescibacteria group bacterium]
MSEPEQNSTVQKLLKDLCSLFPLPALHIRQTEYYMPEAHELRNTHPDWPSVYLGNFTREQLQRISDDEFFPVYLRNWASMLSDCYLNEDAAAQGIGELAELRQREQIYGKELRSNWSFPVPEPVRTYMIENGLLPVNADIVPKELHFE